jgi:DNA-binding LacI/PurR family transcriptional regulator
MTTIYDIAKAAGVTATTVSYVLSGKGSISKATRTRVLKYAREMGYRPNLVARSLIKQQTSTIGLVLPMIINPFYAEIVETAERIAYASGFRLFVTNTYADERLGQELLEDLASRRVDGIIAMPEGLSVQAVHSMITSGLPVVCCMWNEVEEVVGPAVGIDKALGGRLAGEYLLSLGHRRIGIVAHGTEGGRLNHHLRVTGCSEALARAGYPLDPTLLKLGDSSLESGAAAGRELLSLPEQPTAIFATNDLMAIGVIHAAWSMGVRVPRDVSVIGLDDIVLAAYTAPPLTTLAVDIAALARKSMELVFSLIEGKQVSSPPLLTPTLKVRGSTAAPGREAFVHST